MILLKDPEPPSRATHWKSSLEKIQMVREIGVIVFDAVAELKESNA
jgi:hypothetical protein